MINARWHGAKRLPASLLGSKEEAGIEPSIRTLCALRFVRESES
jgi:hypothetical protein